MKQSLPGITAISYLPCANLLPNIQEKHRVGIPVAVQALSTPIDDFFSASCETESEYINGGNSETTTLQFRTTDEIHSSRPLAFVVTDANNESFLIGTKEEPYPIVEISELKDAESNIQMVKVTFVRRKSLIPCSM